MARGGQRMDAEMRRGPGTPQRRRHGTGPQGREWSRYGAVYTEFETAVRLWGVGAGIEQEGSPVDEAGHRRRRRGVQDAQRWGDRVQRQSAGKAQCEGGQCRAATGKSDPYGGEMQRWCVHVWVTRWRRDVTGMAWRARAACSGRWHRGDMKSGITIDQKNETLLRKVLVTSGHPPHALCVAPCDAAKVGATQRLSIYLLLRSVGDGREEQGTSQVDLQGAASSLCAAPADQHHRISDAAIPGSSVAYMGPRSTEMRAVDAHAGLDAQELVPAHAAPRDGCHCTARSGLCFLTSARINPVQWVSLSPASSSRNGRAKGGKGRETHPARARYATPMGCTPCVLYLTESCPPQAILVSIIVSQTRKEGKERDDNTQPRVVLVARSGDQCAQGRVRPQHGDVIAQHREHLRRLIHPFRQRGDVVAQRRKHLCWLAPPRRPLHATVFSALRAGEAERADPALDPELGVIEDSASERELEVCGTEVAAERGGDGVKGCEAHGCEAQVRSAGCAGVRTMGGAKVTSECRVERGAVRRGGWGVEGVEGVIQEVKDEEHVFWMASSCTTCLRALAGSAARRRYGEGPAGRFRERWV
ncbi:hypothetical protein B0H14DRAFT_3146654 [Mycena olivaceomarginata]|nr:hypothetical protein B0H14DRAFT_3146654 [Mycena olivaceomarginata]